MVGLEFVDWSTVFVKTVFKSSFCFSYVLFVAAVAVYHLNNVFRVTVYMMSNMSSFAGRMKCVAGTFVCYVVASFKNSCLHIEKIHGVGCFV